MLGTTSGPVSAQDAMTAQPGAAVTPAADSPYRWERAPFVLIAERGFEDMNGSEIDGDMLFERDASAPNDVVLACIGNRTMVAVSTGEDRAYEALPGSFSRIRARPVSVKVYINDEQVKSPKWIYNKKTQLIYPGSSAMARRIYNSAIRGDAVRLKYKGERELTLPKPDVVFASWGAPCGIGNNAKDVNRERMPGPYDE